MTLPTSGPITASDINVELGRAADALFSMDGAEERALAQVPSGAIAMSNFYGKSSAKDIEYIARADQLNTVTGKTITIATPPGTVEGDVMLGVISCTGRFSIGTLPSGWSGEVGGTSKYNNILYKVATANEPASHLFEFGLTATYSGSILTYRNAVFVSATTVETRNLVVPSLESTQENSLMVCLMANYKQDVVLTPPASMTTRVQDVNGAIQGRCIAEELLPAVGPTGTRTFTAGSGSTTDNYNLTAYLHHA